MHMISSGPCPPLEKFKVGAVVVAFHPDSDFEARLGKFADQASTLVVIDNSEDLLCRRRIETVCRKRGWDLVSRGRNEGVGAGFNTGIKILASRGFQWALLFDQDSEPDET